MTSKLRIIVTGLIAQYPLGGVTWDYFQYALGLARLGHEVYYLEDTGQWPYNPVEGGVAKDCSFNVEYLAGLMSRFGLAEQWAYRFPWQSQWFGLSEAKRREVIQSADLLINVSGTLERPEEYRQVRRLAYIDSDPVFTQLKLARGQLDFRKWIDLHDVQFSFGESLSPAVPDTGHQWRPTRQPIVLSEWHPETPQRDVFTTVMNWTSYKPVVYGNQSYGQKDVEFMRFRELPSLVIPTPLEIAVNAGKTRRTPRQLLAHKGWHVVDPAEVCPNLDTYRQYVESSKAEWSVAKNGYVLGQPGWFSCRSACYLAAGRPVVVQDTGFSAVLPVGEGLLAFSTVEEAVAGIKEIEANYARHAKAARALAVEYFDAAKVLTWLIDEALQA
ncbi:MAG TPA: glycosyltransferase family 1 protein [Candidatus Tectomicrobia bacterium]|nr:glycosyltransferase family 1 protein [Candidatus Tectomicrobia bacterium]